MFEKKLIHQSNTFDRNINKEKTIKNIYYGEVVDINDKTDGGKIKVRISELDSPKSSIENIPDSYPLLPKFLHIYPQVGELVRIYIEDIRYPQRGRFWMGNMISQLHKINYDNKYTALSTTNVSLTSPEPAPSTFPDAEGVFPKKNEIALIGRNNTDIILRDNELEIRAGKHELDEVLKLNKQNPATLKLNFEQNTGNTNTTTSSAMIMGDKIALISHEGSPKFKAYDINSEDRSKIFKEGHPLGRADVIVEIFEVFRKAIINHIHPYPKMSADKSDIITDLEKIDLTKIIQENIVIN